MGISRTLQLMKAIKTLETAEVLAAGAEGAEVSNVTEFHKYCMNITASMQHFVLELYTLLQHA